MRVLETINCQNECGNCKVFVGCMEGIYRELNRELDKEEMRLKSEVNNLYKRGGFKVSVFGELIFTDCEYCEKNYNDERCHLKCRYKYNYSSSTERVQLSDSELLYDLVILRRNTKDVTAMSESMKIAQEAYVMAIADIKSPEKFRYIPKSAYNYVRFLEAHEDEKAQKALKRAKKAMFSFGIDKKNNETRTPGRIMFNF